VRTATAEVIAAGRLLSSGTAARDKSIHNGRQNRYGPVSHVCGAGSCSETPARASRTMDRGLRSVVCRQGSRRVTVSTRSMDRSKDRTSFTPVVSA
jgi:hypothetical protein